MPLPLFLHRLLSVNQPTAEVIKQRKKAVDDAFTLAQQRAHTVFTRDNLAVMNLAAGELDALVCTLRNAQQRAKDLAETGALAAELGGKTVAIRDELSVVIAAAERVA